MITWTEIESGGANLPEGNPWVLVTYNGSVCIGERVSEEIMSIQGVGGVPIEDLTHFSTINMPE